jgi:hypothetical protein
MLNPDHRGRTWCGGGEWGPQQGDPVGDLAGFTFTFTVKDCEPQLKPTILIQEEEDNWEAGLWVV